MTPIILAAVGTAPVAVHAPAPPADLFAINGVKLGMSLQAWRALPRPGSAPDHVITTCKPMTLESAPSAETSRHGLACRYVARYGAYELPVSFPLVGTSRIRAPVFEFRDDRLVAIRIQTTADAYDQVMAVLRREYGSSPRTVRDAVQVEGVALPRVRASWRMPGETITLTDPAPRVGRLEVRLAVASARAPG